MEDESDRDLSATLTVEEILNEKGVQKILELIAKEEFGKDFLWELYDPVEYAIHAGFKIKKI